MCAVPFLQPIHRFPLTAFYSEWLAFALGLMGALVLVREEPWREGVLPVVALAPFALILVIGLQVALGRVPYPEQALIATLYLLWSALLMCAGRALARELGVATVVRTLAWFLLAGGLANAAVGLVQHYAVPMPLDHLITPKVSAQVYGNLAQPNHYAAYLALALASAGCLYSLGRLRGISAAACSAPLLAMMTLSGSRSPWLYLGAFMVLALTWYRLARGSESRRLAVFALWQLPAFVAAQVIVSLPVLGPPDGLQVISSERLFETASGIAARVELARGAWQMFAAAPFIGAGWGQFAWHHFLNLAAGAASLSPSICNHAHNLVLHLLAETGAVATLAVVGVLGWWIVDFARGEADAARWWLLAVLAVIGLHSMLEYPLWYAYFLGVTAALLGAGAQRVVKLELARAARLVAALGILAGSVHLAMVLAPYREFERQVFSKAALTAVHTEDVYVDLMSRLHRDPLLAPYVELVVAHGIRVSREGLDQQLDLNTRVMHFAPVNVVVYRQAFLLALAGEREAAITQLERAARAYPGELAAMLPELETLATEHPDAYHPLLEWAASEIAQRRAGGSAR